MLTSKGAVGIRTNLIRSVSRPSKETGSRRAARLLPAARANLLHMQRIFIWHIYSNAQLRQRATITAAAPTGSRSDESDRASSKTYDVPVTPQNIDVHTFLNKVFEDQIAGLEVHATCSS